jgi:DNA-binding CsgD family transcriptional regulator
MKDVPIAVAAMIFDSNRQRLTVKERRMLDHMLRAESSKETARKLGLAVSTIKNLRSRVLGKMMAENSGSLLVIAAHARAFLSQPALAE